MKNNQINKTFNILLFCGFLSLFLGSCSISKEYNKKNKEEKKIGVWTEIDSTDEGGHVIIMSKYKEDIREGKAQVFSRDLRSKGKYVNGRKHGKWSVYENNILIRHEYYATGVVSRIERIKDGKVVDSVITDPPF